MSLFHFKKKTNIFLSKDKLNTLFKKPPIAANYSIEIEKRKIFFLKKKYIKKESNITLDLYKSKNWVPIYRVTALKLNKNDKVRIYLEYHVDNSISNLFNINLILVQSNLAK